MKELDGNAFKNRILEKITPQKPSPWGFSIGLDPGLINRIFNEERIPTAKHLLKISRALGVSVDWLLTGEELQRTAQVGSKNTLEVQKYIDKLVSIITDSDQMQAGKLDERINNIYKEILAEKRIENKGLM